MLLTFRFLHRKLSILLALVVMLWTWRSQSRSCAIMTPRYFTEVTLARVCSWYDDFSSFFILMGLMTWRVVHFPGWKDMSQLFSHISSCWRSFCDIDWSHKVSRKQNLLALFSHRRFSLPGWHLMQWWSSSSWKSWFYHWINASGKITAFLSYLSKKTVTLPCIWMFKNRFDSNLIWW